MKLSLFNIVAAKNATSPAKMGATALRVVKTPRFALTMGLCLACAALGVHPAHATDTGTVDSSNLDSGAFNGVVGTAGTYLNALIKNFGVPAILVSLAVSGWGFLRHIAKSAFH